MLQMVCTVYCTLVQGTNRCAAQTLPTNKRGEGSRGMREGVALRRTARDARAQIANPRARRGPRPTDVFFTN